MISGNVLFYSEYWITIISGKVLYEVQNKRPFTCIKSNKKGHKLVCFSPSLWLIRYRDYEIHMFIHSLKDKGKEICSVGWIITILNAFIEIDVSASWLHHFMVVILYLSITTYIQGTSGNKCSWLLCSISTMRWLSIIMHVFYTSFLATKDLEKLMF